MNRNYTLSTSTVMLVVLWVCGLGTSALCETEHDHDRHIHDAAGYELGLSVGHVRLKAEKEEAPSLHLHLMKRLGGEGLQQYFSVGVGVESIFSDHDHYAAMGTLGIHPWRNLAVRVSPGIIWAKHEEGWESEYATHLEVAYPFSFGKFDIGPVIGYSKTAHEEHTMVGIHMGIHLGH